MATNREWYVKRLQAFFSRAERELSKVPNERDEVLAAVGTWLQEKQTNEAEEGARGPETQGMAQKETGPDCPDYVFGAMLGEFTGSPKVQRNLERARFVGEYAVFLHSRVDTLP
jgi:hypothetical protein